MLLPSRAWQVLELQQQGLQTQLAGAEPVLARRLVKNWVPRPKAHVHTALWVLAHCKRSSLHKEFYFKPPIRLVFRRWPVSKAWQALSPAFSKVWAQQLLGLVSLLPVSAQEPLAQHRPRASEPQVLFKALAKRLAQERKLLAQPV